MQLEPGTIVDRRYHIRGLLGAGGMARVYAARDERLGVDVAVKVLSLPSAAIRERLISEGRVQAALKHPNVLPVSDIVEIDGLPGLVMELVNGPPLDELLRRCPVDAVEAEHLARGIIAGVRAAHDLGLVHRDLKPGNVLVARFGDRLLPKVADFGLVKLLDEGNSGTRSGATLGTPRYMAPEQVRDSKSVDSRADIFSLGAILYELFTGEPAFEGADTYEIFNAVVEGRYRPVRELADVPDRVLAAIEGALQPDLDSRFADIAALLRALDGDAGPPREVWRSELLDTVDELGADPESAEIRPSGSDTWTASIGDATGTTDAADDSETMFSVISQDVTSETRNVAPSRTPMWRAVALLAAMLVGGVGMVALLPDAEAPPFTVAGAPSLDDPAADKLLDRAWVEYQANEDEYAQRHVRQALEAGADDPELYLLAAALEMSFWDFDGFREYLAHGVAASEGQQGAVADLLRALYDNYERGEDLSWWKPVLDGHLEQYPDDWLARCLLGMGMVIVPEFVPPDDAFLDDLIARNPDAIAGWVIKLDVLRRSGRNEEALAVNKEAIDKHPGSAALHGWLATWGLTNGDPQMAIEQGNAALRIDPSYWHGRLMAAVAALSLGEQAEYERLVAPMIGPETPRDQVHRFGLHISRSLASFGQMDEAARWWQRFEQAALDEGDHSWVLIGLGDQVEEATHRWICDDAELERRVRRLDKAVAAPTVPAAARKDPGLISVFAHGVLDARAGELAEAERAVETLRERNPSFAGRVEAEIWRQQQDVEALADLDAECWPLVWRATALLDLGHRDPAARAFDKAAATCPGTHTLPFALTAAGQALIASEAGDAQAEASVRQTLGELWRHPDPDLPVMVRLAGE